MKRNHLNINRDLWNAAADDWVAMGEDAWAAAEPYWGIWELPDASLKLLPEDMAGLDTVELGCGTGYVSAWMARRGARATGIDLSSAQLATARRLAAAHDTPLTLIEGDAEQTGLPSECCDFAISEYGAAIWCDPARWIPEAHRLLRPGGRLVFLGHHLMTVLAAPLDGADLDRRLHRPYRGLGRTDWTGAQIDPGGIEFSLGVSDWLALFRKTGFTVEHYQELFAPEAATGSRFGIPADWARDYPCEQVWHLRKTA